MNFPSFENFTTRLLPSFAVTVGDEHITVGRHATSLGEVK